MSEGVNAGSATAGTAVAGGLRARGYSLRTHWLRLRIDPSQHGFGFGAIKARYRRHDHAVRFFEQFLAIGSARIERRLRIIEECKKPFAVLSAKGRFADPVRQVGRRRSNGRRRSFAERKRTVLRRDRAGKHHNRGSTATAGLCVEILSFHLLFSGLRQAVQVPRCVAQAKSSVKEKAFKSVAGKPDPALIDTRKTNSITNEYRESRGVTVT
jgi:hypothetical protein